MDAVYEYNSLTTLGQHYLVEFVDCDPERLKFLSTVEPDLLEAVKRAEAQYVSHSTKQFEPEGVSLVVMIEESHFSIHTWPENGCAALDIFTCGEMKAMEAINYLSRAFAAERTQTRVLARGFDEKCGILDESDKVAIVMPGARAG